MKENKGHKDNHVVNEEDVSVDSFNMYPSSDDDKTKIKDGKKIIEDFHLYKEEDHDEH